MAIPLPITNFTVMRSTPKVSSTLVRVVPAPKKFIVPAAWEETPSFALSVQVKPQTQIKSGSTGAVLRRTPPLELRLDPTL